MISLNKVYQTVLMLSNSDIRGNVKPRDLALAVNNAINEIYDGYFSELSRMTNRDNRGLVNSGLENIPDRIREKLQHFLVEDYTMSFVQGKFILPADHRYSDTATYLDAELEFCKNKRHFDIVKNDADAKPTTAYPIALRIGDGIKVAPSTITGNVKLTYLRNHIMPKWTFTVVNGTEIFNPAANDFQDIDMHPAEEMNIVIKTLSTFGINLKAEDVQAYAARAEGKTESLENTL